MDKHKLDDGTPPPDPALLLEQYRIFVESMDRHADRRQSANSFFFSLLAGLFAAVAYLYSKDTDEALRPLTWLVTLSGVPISIFWALLIGSYRSLGTAKFAVIHEMEKCLPFTPFTTEWEHLEQGKTSKYRPLTHLEVWIPRFFIVVFAVLTVWLIPWALVFPKSQPDRLPDLSNPPAMQPPPDLEPLR